MTQTYCVMSANNVLLINCWKMFLSDNSCKASEFELALLRLKMTRDLMLRQISCFSFGVVVNIVRVSLSHILQTKQSLRVLLQVHPPLGS